MKPTLKTVAITILASLGITACNSNKSPAESTPTQVNNSTQHQVVEQEAQTKPTEQARLKAEAKAKAEQEAQAKAAEQARVEAEAKAKAEQEAQAKATEQARLEAEAKERAEQQEARIKSIKPTTIQQNNNLWVDTKIKNSVLKSIEDQIISENNTEAAQGNLVLTESQAQALSHHYPALRTRGWSSDEVEEVKIKSVNYLIKNQIYSSYGAIIEAETNPTGYEIYYPKYQLSGLFIAKNPSDEAKPTVKPQGEAIYKGNVIAIVDDKLQEDGNVMLKATFGQAEDYISGNIESISQNKSFELPRTNISNAQAHYDNNGTSYNLHFIGKNYDEAVGIFDKGWKYKAAFGSVKQ